MRRVVILSRPVVILSRPAVILSEAKDLARRWAVLAAMLFAPVVAVPQSTEGLRCSVARDPEARWGLPSALAEVSGMAIGPGGRILAQGDEVARVVELDAGSGKMLRRFTLKGQPKGDFEGVAADEGSVALMTSSGRIHLFKLPPASGGVAYTEVAYTTVETGLGKSCEMEGLAWDTRGKMLLIPCKNGKTPATRSGLTVFRWSMDGKGSVAVPITVSGDVLSRSVGTPQVNLTAVDLDPVSGHLLLLSSRPAVVIELDQGGRIVGVGRLRDELHPQAEGLAVTKDALYIGDEGAGRRGTIAKYSCEAKR